MNEGACFSVPGPGIIPKNPAHLHFLLAYINSFAAGYAIEALIGGGDFSIKGTAARHLEPGYMKHLPEVVISADDATWFSSRVNALLRLLEVVISDETDPLFSGLQIHPTMGLNASLETATREAFGRFKHAYGIIEDLEKKITALLQIPEDRVQDTYSDTGWPWAEERILPDINHSVILTTDPLSPRSGVLTSDFGSSKHRFEMKLSHYLHAGVERYAAFLKVSPIAVCELLTKRAKASPSALIDHAAGAISYVFGSVFGRWDIRYAGGDIRPPELPDPFAPLPACPPGMLQGDDDLPLSPEVGRQQRAEGLYPLDVALRTLFTDIKRKSTFGEFILEQGDPLVGTQDRCRIELRERDHAFFETNFLRHADLAQLTGLLAGKLSDPQKHLAENAQVLLAGLSKLDSDRRDALAAFLLQHTYLVIVSTASLESASRTERVVQRAVRPADLAGSCRCGNAQLVVRRPEVRLRRCLDNLLHDLLEDHAFRSERN